MSETLDLASRGEMDPEFDRLTPVAIDPHIWELCFTFGGHEFRLYFGEPTAYPNHLVALHFHHKTIVEGDHDQTRRLQNSEMMKAIARFRNGEAWQWPQIGDA